jgi:hypothetical protein
MLRLSASVLLTLLSVGASSALSPNDAAILGVWNGKVESLPAITLTVERENGELAGAVLFYLIRRNPAGHSTASPGVPEPLISPKFNGHALIFLVSHRYAHPPSSANDPPKKFRLELTGTNKGRLITEEGRAINVIRNFGPPGAFP